MPEPIFTPELFRFLEDLKRHNERAWFEANKGRYREHVQGPMVEFVRALAPRLEKISPRFVADDRANGRSIFRIHRDTRFSADKSPYKTWAAMRFQHESGRDVHTPGFYLHLEPGGCFFGAGLWHPDSRTAGVIRAHLDGHRAGWKRVLGSNAIRGGELALTGESLKRPPRGFDADDPLIEDLKRKDFVVSAPLSEDEVLAPGFVGDFARRCRGASPLVRFLTEAVGEAFE
ncbi:MAG: DUF2461 domain-containing protein [Phycisphaerales bacterium JB040]